MVRRNNTISNIDWVTVLIYLVLVFLGWINIYSALFSEESSSILDIGERYGKQLIWIGFSLFLAMLIMIVDSKFFVTFGYLFYAVFVFLLILVLFVGKEVNGARSWFEFGGLRLQPAEFAKYGASLAIAKLLSSYNFSFKDNRRKLAIIGILLVPVVLIILQNDTGSALVYFVFLIPLFREGMSGLILFFGVLAAVLFILSLVLSPLYVVVMLIIMALLAGLIIRRNWNEIFKAVLVLIAYSVPFILYWVIFKDGSIDFHFVLWRASLLSAVTIFLYSIMKRIPQVPLVSAIFLISVLFTFTVEFAFNNILEKHHQDRINNLLGIESDPLGAGYNVNQSKIAIGSGGFAGKGFLDGTQTKYNFVPEQDTDFIFCTVGEEWGFVGTTFVVVLFLFLLFRLVMLAERQRSVFSRVFGYCVAAIIFFHFTINIGMTIGLAPVIGIPLPFFSYGGSSLWFFTILLFTFLRLDTSRLEQLH